MNFLGCKNSSYSFKAFSYPPSSKPHEANWEYSGRVIVTSREKGSLSKESEKFVQIIIKDKSKRIYLSDKLKFKCGNIDALIMWDQFEKLEVTLLEVGNKFANDDYNKELRRKGPIRLTNLKYRYDPELQEFKRLATASTIEK